MVDRRHFHLDGSPRPDAPPHEPPPKPSGTEASETKETVEKATDPRFMELAESLAVQTLMAMGQMADPMTGAPAEANPTMAKRFMGFLEAMKSKAEEGLSSEEKAWFSQTLQKLQMVLFQPPKANP